MRSCFAPLKKNQTNFGCISRIYPGPGSACHLEPVGKRAQGFQDSGAQGVIAYFLGDSFLYYANAKKSRVSGIKARDFFVFEVFHLNPRPLDRVRRKPLAP